MSLATPTTATISENIISQLEGSFAQTIPLLPKAFQRVLAKVLAGVIVLLYRYCGFIFLQLFVAYATDKETTVNGRVIRPLVEWGRLVGVGDPNPAGRAELVVELPVTAQVGSIAAGQQMIRVETQVVYAVTAAVPLDAPTVEVTIRAVSGPGGTDGSGTVGNLQPGDIVALANPLPNVASKATVLSQAVTADDAEPPDRYRGRIIDRFQRRPQGGAYADYEAWGEEVPGIVNVFPYAGELPSGSGPGWVDVYVEASAETAEDEDGTPTTAQLEAVEAAINLDVGGKATRRPVSARLNVQPITRVGFAVEVGGLDPDSPELRAALNEGVDEYLRSRKPFIEGLSVLPRVDRITTAAISGIVDTIVGAEGATVTTVTVTPGFPAYTLDHGELAKLDGEIAFV